MVDTDPKLNSVEIVSLTPEMWQTYKEIRLKGLLEDPQAFGSSYERESSFTEEKWLERANNPYNLIALENNSPLGTMGAYFTEESGNKVANIVGVFVSSEARGKGVGSQLLKALLAKIKEDSTAKTVKLSVNKDQTAAVTLYQNYGFIVVGEELQIMGDDKEHIEYNMELHL